MYITYEFLCPTCQQETRISRCAGQPVPVYCSWPCYVRRPDTMNTSWRRYEFDDLMTAAIVKASRGPKGSLKRLWETDPRFKRAGIPYAIMKRQAVLKGAIKSVPTSTWSPEEEAFVVRRWERGSPADSIAKAMRREGWRRSPSAIRAHMAHIQADRRGQYLTLQPIADGLGVDAHVVARWVDHGWLRVHHTSETGTFRYVTYPELRRFIIERPGLIARGQPDLVWLIGMLVYQGAGETQDVEGGSDETGAWMNGDTITDRAAGD